jgi:glycosyltransferase involved in cell wall biosynthesis
VKLAIVSHTRHFYSHNGTLHGWGPTIREINFLAKHFSQIIHAACLHPGLPPPSAMPYTSPNISFVPLPPSGGSGFGDKISAFMRAREVMRSVKPLLAEADTMQLRVPTGMANYLLPWLTMQKRRPLTWVKYAGNWGQKDAPAGYRFQRWWLERNFLGARVTINGRWPGQKAHCISFENPCLDHDERMAGRNAVETKQYAPPFVACFIGRMETAKGVGRILDALPELKSKGVKTIHFIGDGKDLEFYRGKAASGTGVACHFLGSIARPKLAGFLANAHFLLLPSTASEGFPKVIAEGANYGAIPVVSGISSIGQYVSDANGYLWDMNMPFGEWLGKVDWSESVLPVKARAAYNMAEAFTFEHYYRKLRSEILHDFKPGDFS